MTNPDLRHIDREMDRLLAGQITIEVQRMKADGVGADDIKAYVALKWEAFEGIKQMTLAELVAFVTGHEIIRPSLQ